jgi:hypothetical protein
MKLEVELNRMYALEDTRPERRTNRVAEPDIAIVPCLRKKWRPRTPGPPTKFPLSEGERAVQLY